MKPKYIYLYNSENGEDKILHHYPFNNEDHIRVRRGKYESIYEYEHFDLFCYKMSSMLTFRGHKCWELLIEEVLYDSLDEDAIGCLYGMISPTIMGGITKIY